MFALAILFSLVSFGNSADVRVPFGGINWNSLQIIGIDNKTIAGVEMRWLADDDSALCEYPKIKDIPSPDPENNFAGVYLIGWEIPPIGKCVRPKEKKRFSIYRENHKSKGCTPAKESADTLNKAKLELPWKATVEKVLVFSDQEKKQFQGQCFITKKKKIGCSINPIEKDFLGEKVGLTLNLKAASDCVEETDADFEHGCQADRTYSGVLTIADKRFPFSILAEKSKSQVYTQNELRGVEVYGIGSARIAVFLFAQVHISAREKTPIFLRLR